MTSSIGQDFHFVAYYGNTKVLPFVLKRYGTKDRLDVSAAIQILLEIEDPNQVALSPLVANPAFPGANWAQGEVPILVTPADVTGAVGTWIVGFTLFLGNEEDTTRSGTIEVKHRPGYPAP